MNRYLKFILLPLALIATAVAVVMAVASDSSTVPLEANESTRSSCPHRASLEEARQQQPHGHGNALVPLDPRAALICRYFGFPPRQGGEGRIDQLAAERILRSSRAAERMALAFAESERLKPSLEHGPVACPNDTGAWLFALFQYAGDPSVRVVVPLSGCQFVFSNAAAHFYVLSGQMKRQLLAALVPVKDAAKAVARTAQKGSGIWRGGAKHGAG